MSEDKKTTTASDKVPSGASATSQGAAATVAKDLYGANKQRGRGGRDGGGRGRGRNDERGKDEMEQKILEIARVTRVMAGGKRMNFRACVALGDKKGTVGVGLGKGADVTMAVNKAVNQAKKNMVKVPMVNDTIPHAVVHKMGAARIILKPAKKGRGVISGGVTRVIFELAGVKNITTKTLGTNNKINNARCTIEAISCLRTAPAKEVPAKEVVKSKE